MIIENIMRWLSELSSKLIPEEAFFSAPDIRIDDEIKRAHQEWIRAQKYFECVADPDLVDHAIFVEEAARRKYTYLLKKARELGINTRKLQ
jgi:hypothetical protein